MHNSSNFNAADSSNSKYKSQAIDVDKLAALATNDPEAFERYRQKLHQRAIDKAPKELQRRLKGMQFRINLAREYSNCAQTSCRKISSMMHDSLAELEFALANPQAYLSEQDNANIESAEIISLFPNR